MVQELLNVGVILPSTSHYSSPMVMVLKKEGSWCMCTDFRTHNKLTIKYKFIIHVLDDLLDELSGAQFFTKLDFLFWLPPDPYERGRHSQDSLSNS